MANAFADRHGGQKQSLIVFQPLLPPDWKMTLREGSLYAQVAFFAAQGRDLKQVDTAC